MARGTWPLVLLCGIQCVVIAIPFNDAAGAPQLESEIRQARQKTVQEDFSKGFSKDFAADMPTKEFLGNFHHGRQKRQVGVTSAIDNILNSHYEPSLATDHLQALLTRNNFRRPARDSTGPVPVVQPQPPKTQSFQPDFRTQQQSQPPRTQSFQPDFRTQQQSQPPRAQSFQPDFRTQQQSQPPRTQSFQPDFRTQQQSQPPRTQSFQPDFRTQQQRQPTSVTRPQRQPQTQPTSFRPFTPNFSSQQRQPPPPAQNFSPNQPDFSAQRGRTGGNEFGFRSSPRSPSRARSPSRPANRPPQIASRNDAPRQEPFPSATFAGQQFARPFPAFEDFSQPQSQSRKKRQIAQEEGVSQKLTEILSTPYKGSIPNSLSSLYDRNDRFQRKAQVNAAPPSIQAIETTVTENQEATSSANPFEIPFAIPNFFEKFGIQKRSADVAARRQGIADALDDIIQAPYQGSVPSSIESLFNLNKNRFVRKTKPSTNINLISQPGPQGQSATQLTPLASDDPSVAAGRLVPNSQDPSGYSVNLGSSHIFYRTNHGRQRRSAVRRQSKPHYVVRRFPLRRIQSNHLRSHIKGVNSPVKDPEHDSKRNLNKPPGGKSEEYQRHNTLDIASVDVIKPLDFMSNFNTPFEIEIDIEDPHNLEAISTSEELGVRPSQRQRQTVQNRPAVPFHGRPRPQPFTAPGLRPGPSPPAYILPASSTVRAPRHLIMENRRLPKATRQLDIPIHRRSMDVAESGHSIHKVSPDNPAAREDSQGFMEGVPHRFPSFSEVGGFGPMPAKKDNVGTDSFMVEFKPPVEVEIPDIQDNQPQFNLPQFTQQKQEISAPHPNSRNGQKLERTKRANEFDAADDISLAPQKRIKRVDPIPPTNSPAESRNLHDNQAAYSDIPFDFQPFPDFQYPVFQYEKIRPTITPSREYNVSPYPARGINRKVEVRTSDDDFIVPESQRFYPNFNPRFTPSHQGPSTQSFYPSTLPTPRGPAPRTARFNGHGPGFRESSGFRNNAGFRDFHDTFYGPGTREAVNRPEFVFPSSKRPLHPENEPLDNTLLGSGNFEVLKGGTFYDEDDPHIYDGYDHDQLLHGDYYGSHSPSNRPHTNNHVDDFFSNFRDFSEFAARRSDEGEGVDDHSFFGSEQISHVVNISQPYSPVVFANETFPSDEGLAQDGADKKELSKTPDPSQAKEVPKAPSKENTKQKQLKLHRQPKNIQEVMEDLEASESSDNAVVSSSSTDEKDPMMAMF
ncbi:uncharacterized protein LOC135217987 [Macrobrachium nipponense]|uniref:uncharacterized protein LOC135217987 n=1 Tax=Macrobrachium nipponense TaxID=159736 RepID=UPI0030C7A72C